MSNPEITKETLEYLAGLARIKLDPERQEKTLADLQNIVAYISELKSVDTSGVEPMSGGTLLKNSFREDDALGANRAEGREQFPNIKDDYLKVPPVFGDGGNRA